MSSVSPPSGTNRSQSGTPRSKTPEARRLRRFTSDPRYSARLKQLPRGEQRRLLDLVAANQGRQARKELQGSYEAHRERKNEQARARRLARSVDESLRNVGRQLPEARLNRMERQFEQMSWQERKFAKTATREQLRDRARNGPKTIMIDGVEYNPFWYG